MLFPIDRYYQNFWHERLFIKFFFEGGYLTVEMETITRIRYHKSSLYEWSNTYISTCLHNPFKLNHEVYLVCIRLER